MHSNLPVANRARHLNESGSKPRSAFKTSLEYLPEGVNFSQANVFINLQPSANVSSPITMLVIVLCLLLNAKLL